MDIQDCQRTCDADLRELDRGQLSASGGYRSPNTPVRVSVRPLLRIRYPAPARHQPRHGGHPVSTAEELARKLCVDLSRATSRGRPCCLWASCGLLLCNAVPLTYGVSNGDRYRGEPRLPPGVCSLSKDVARSQWLSCGGRSPEGRGWNSPDMAAVHSGSPALTRPSISYAGFELPDVTLIPVDV